MNIESVTIEKVKGEPSLLTGTIKHQSFTITDSNVEINEDDKETAIASLKKVLLKNHPDELKFEKLRISPNEIKETHLEVTLSDFYEGRANPAVDSLSSSPEPSISDDFISFETLISDVKRFKYMCITGNPGSGKSTCAKRLARYLLESHSCVAFFFNFTDLNDCEYEKKSLKEILIDNQNLQISSEEKENAFQWITDNPQNCYIIIDGIKPLKWNIRNTSPSLDETTPQAIQNLLKKFCQGHLLPKGHLIITCRRQALVNIPKTYRPHYTFLLRGVNFETTRKLFDAFVNDKGKAHELWQSLVLKTPCLQSLCHNPLMLQLYVRAVLKSSKTERFVTTMSAVFHTFLENLRASSQISIPSDTVLHSLARIAYETTQSQADSISIKDLNKENLKSADVEDLMISFLKSSSTGPLFKEVEHLHFLDPVFQSYFAALYIIHAIPMWKFENFVKIFMLNVSQWSVVAQFVFGITLTPKAGNAFDAWSGWSLHHFRFRK